MPDPKPHIEATLYGVRGPYCLGVVDLNPVMCRAPLSPLQLFYILMLMALNQFPQGCAITIRFFTIYVRPIS